MHWPTANFLQVRSGLAPLDGSERPAGGPAARGAYCFSNVTRMLPMVSVPEVRVLVATAEITSPALTVTVWLESEQITAAAFIGAAIVQVRAVAVGIVLVTNEVVGVVLSVMVPVAAAVRLRPQFVGRPWLT